MVLIQIMTQVHYLTQGKKVLIGANAEHEGAIQIGTMPCMKNVSSPLAG